MHILIDPTYNFPHATPDEIINDIGVLFHWLLDGIKEGQNCHDAVTSRYEFLTPEMQGGTVAEDGVYTYRGDPELFPLASFTSEETDEIVFFYRYAMIAFYDTDTGKARMYRMD